MHSRNNKQTNLVLLNVGFSQLKVLSTMYCTLVAVEAISYLLAHSSRTNASH